MWRIIIAWLTPMVMGILWSDTGVPCSALSLVATNITHDVQVVLELAPPHLNQPCYEVDDDLLKVMKSPSLSKISFTIHLAIHISNAQST